jgi:hypothetical protein
MDVLVTVQVRIPRQRSEEERPLIVIQNVVGIRS